MQVAILGTPYTVTRKKYKEDEAFERRSIAGYCDAYAKRIVVCDMSTYKDWEHEDPETVKVCEKTSLRHEIVHAFFAESGLMSNALSPSFSWAENEEMVDWIALKGPAIYQAWQAAGAL